MINHANDYPCYSSLVSTANMDLRKNNLTSMKLVLRYGWVCELWQEGVVWVWGERHSLLFEHSTVRQTTHLDLRQLSFYMMIAGK